MANVTANEQLMLELINRARLDPQSEAQRLGIDLNQGLAAGTISTTPKQPLAFNGLLIEAARDHSVWQIEQDIFSHTGAGGSSPGDRMTDAGYRFEGSWTWGENISWRGTLPGPIDAAAAIVQQHDDLFLSPGHRQNILNGDFREIGVGQAVGGFLQNGQNWSASMVTQDFALSGSRIFLTGVLYQDTNSNGYYGLGEGLSQRQVSLLQDGRQTQVRTNAYGGYEAVMTPGTNRVSVQSASPVVVEIQAADQNIKLDLAGTRVLSSASITLLSGTTGARLLGIAPNAIQGSSAGEELTGNSGANRLTGAGGKDRLDGGTGADTLLGGSGADTLTGGPGNDLLIGGLGNDSLTGGTEADRFKFVTTGEGVDRLTDFVSGADRIQVVSPNFGGLAVGALPASRFLAAGTPLTTGNAVFLYNATTGALAFDSDGNGGGAAIAIATLTGPKTLRAGDIQVVAA